LKVTQKFDLGVLSLPHGAFVKKPAKKRLQRKQPEVLRQRALARWEAEGGAEAVTALDSGGTSEANVDTSEANVDTSEANVDTSEASGGVRPTAESSPSSKPAAPWSDAECQQLHARLIALENLVISLLAMGNKRQLALARDMASHIIARRGATPHRLTEQAAKQMVHVVGRAKWFRDHG